MIDEKMRSKSTGLLVIFIYLLSLSVFFLTVSEAVCNLQDRDSLLLFSTNVSSPLSPLHWNTSTDCCSWEGISCDDSPQNRVTAILLPSRGLSGTLPPSVLNLHRLSQLNISYNRFNKLSGEIPKEIYNLSNLEELLLPANQLSGNIDDGITSLTKLRLLDLYFNQLQGEIPKNIGKLFNLRRLQLHINNLTGSVPVSLSNCTKLVKLNLRVNLLGGTLSNVDFSRFQSLSVLDLGNNSFTGDFPSTVYSCKNLTAMRGVIPAWLIKLKSVELMDLSQNQLVGSIPGWLGTLPNLFYLDLSSNLLTGELPKELFQLSALMSQKVYDATERSYLELPVFVSPNNVTSNQQYNQISSLPPAIYVNKNNLNGTIPVEIGRLKVLIVIELQANNFTGSIPDELSNLTNLERLDLSNNSLSGRIPWSLTGLHFMSYFNVANNTLSGQIPTGAQFDAFPKSYFEGNPLLCGGVLLTSCTSPSTQHSSTKTREKVNTPLVVGLVIGIFFGVSLVLVMLALWVMDKKRRVNPGDSEHAGLEISSDASYSEVPLDSEKDISLVLLFGNSGYEAKDLTIFELLKATNNFSQANIIGCGGFGLVYKATLDNGTNVAVKKLTGDYGLMEKEFKAEVEVLSRAKHENLVDLQGYCVHEGARILIYSFMENGSLDYWLHENPEGPAQLDWSKRLHIMRGASCGLAYMHQVCEPHIVHRDIKSSNILLDGSFKAYLGDFGLSRLILPYRTHVTTELVGTLGYIPPEYGQAWVATLRGDVYSFGVVMLELLTGKRPMEVFKPKVSREIVAWVHQMRKDGKLEEVFDPLLRERGGDEREMIRVLDIACMCVNQNPMRRPNIQQVVDWLNDVSKEEAKEETM
ncbi:hypothetical protein HID58_047269 [Brassica napus]|uniref:Protein kinase domain-containing protein n=1 Tax=Brassica napus TaxID=3708 RepID=A0ABQ8AYV4_BRANA|nr:hypothetical protein HID58_047269 [Brassica napus]